MKKCSHCGTENRDDSICCTYCGKRLDPNDAAKRGRLWIPTLCLLVLLVILVSVLIVRSMGTAEVLTDSPVDTPYSSTASMIQETSDAAQPSAPTVVMTEPSTLLAPAEPKTSVEAWHTEPYMPYSTISAGAYHSVFIRPDGTVGAVGATDKTDDRCRVSDWENIVSVCCSSHTVALTSSGRVLARGLSGNGQCNVSGWENVVGIAVGTDHTVAVLSDGTVRATGLDRLGDCRDVAGWTNIVAVAAGEKNTYGLRSNGTVVVAGGNGVNQYEAESWSDIIRISAGFEHVVGLKADGTVVAAGGKSYGKCDVGDWTNIIAISAGHNFTLGLKADGTVVWAGDNSYHQCDVDDWTDIVEISAGQFHSIGKKKDGSYVATGNNASGQCNLPK